MNGVRPPSYGADDDAARATLTKLWRRALNPILHGTGCGCCSNAGLVLRADWLEEDILDYLATRYAVDPADPLLGFVGERAGRGEAAFLEWLLDASGVALAGPDRIRLLGDVTAVLTSMARAHGPANDLQGHAR